MEYNPTIVFSLDPDWYPQSANEHQWAQISIPAWSDKADIHAGEMSLSVKDLREFGKLCMAAAKYLEGRGGNED